MALVQEVSFSNFKILVGDGGNPETFLPRCSMNASRGVNFESETNDRNIPDCDDDDAPSAIFRYVTAQGATATGSGTLHADDLAFFSAWWKSGEARNVKVQVGTAGQGGEEYAFPCKLLTFNPTAERNNVVEAELNFASHGHISIAALV